jgi:hypothetical protein
MIAPDYQSTAKVPAELQPALDSLVALRQAAIDLEEARVKAEVVYLTQVRAALEADRIDEIADIYVAAHACATKGFHERWREITGRTHAGLATRIAHRARLTALTNAPNGPGGHCWTGITPIGPDEPRPPVGLPVVYVLYGSDGQPIYAGSTDNFHRRLNSHIRDGKLPWTWMAYPCDTREQAYEIEDRNIKVAPLPLNRRAGR